MYFKWLRLVLWKMNCRKVRMETEERLRDDPYIVQCVELEVTGIDRILEVFSK